MSYQVEWSVYCQSTTTCSDISAADLLLSRTMELGPVLGTLEVADKTRLHFANVLSSSDNDQSGFITLDLVTCKVSVNLSELFYKSSLLDLNC